LVNYTCILASRLQVIQAYAPLEHHEALDLYIWGQGVTLSYRPVNLLAWCQSPEYHNQSGNPCETN